jgi:hypothetical protein
MAISIIAFCLIFALVVTARLFHTDVAARYERQPFILPNSLPQTVERYQILNKAVAEVERCIDGDDIKVTRVGAVSAGWDDAIRLSCGETHRSIMLPLGKMPDNIAEQMAAILPSLRRSEAERAAFVAARDAAENSSFIWLYK